MKRINTEKYKDVINSVLIDDRENARVDYAKKQYAPFNPEVCHLIEGDYYFKGDNECVLFEYKTGADFLNSISNNHLHNQLYHMITNHDYSFIIVECDNLIGELNQLYYCTGVDISLSQINGAIAEYCTVSNVLFAQTQYQAFDLMMRVAGKILLNKPYKYSYGKKSKNTALNYLSAIRGLDNKAFSIVTTLKLHTLEDILNLTVEDLINVDGIGKKTAKRIINEIHE